MTIDEIERSLAEHIGEKVLLRKAPLGRTDDLFDAGFDSMSLSRTLVFIEQRFGLAIPDDEIDVDAIDTVEKLARLVQDRLAARGAT